MATKKRKGRAPRLHSRTEENAEICQLRGGFKKNAKERTPLVEMKSGKEGSKRDGGGLNIQHHENISQFLREEPPEKKASKGRRGGDKKQVLLLIPADLQATPRRRGNENRRGLL